MVEGATPPFWPLVRRGGGQRWTGVRTPFASPLRGGRSLHSDPCGKAEIHPWTQALLIIVALTAVALRMCLSLACPGRGRPA